MWLLVLWKTRYYYKKFAKELKTYYVVGEKNVAPFKSYVGVWIHWPWNLYARNSWYLNICENLFFAKFWKCMMCANIKDVYIVWPKTRQRINKSLQILLLFEKIVALNRTDNFSQFCRYRISAYSFRGNYSFLKVENVEIFI